MQLSSFGFVNLGIIYLRELRAVYVLMLSNIEKYGTKSLE